MKLTSILMAGLLLAQPMTRAMAFGFENESQGTVTGFVLPSEVGANEPFTFSATGVVEGEVVEIKTVDGEVVATKKTDKYGRVFLAAGLAAGAYLLSHSGGKGQSQINIQAPRTLPNTANLAIPNPPSNASISQGLTLTGSGLCGNAASNMVTLGGKEVPILASTATEIKTGPMLNQPCGFQDVKVQNTETGQKFDVQKCLIYDLRAHVGRTKIVNGERTSLDFAFSPKDVNATVHARILSGPVSFPGGGKETDAQVREGKASIPLLADPSGSGMFRVAFDLQGINPPEGPIAGGQDKKEKCPKSEHKLRPGTGWKSGEKDVPDPSDPKKKKHVYTATRKNYCYIHSGCSKDKGHAGDCNFTKEKRCKDGHDTTDEKQFDTKDERDTFLKENR